MPWREPPANTPATIAAGTTFRCRCGRKKHFKRSSRFCRKRENISSPSRYSSLSRHLIAGGPPANVKCYKYTRAKDSKGGGSLSNGCHLTSELGVTNYQTLQLWMYCLFTSVIKSTNNLNATIKNTYIRYVTLKKNSC